MVTWNGVAMVGKSNVDPWATLFTDALGHTAVMHSGAINGFN